MPTFLPLSSLSLPAGLFLLWVITVWFSFSAGMTHSPSAWNKRIILLPRVSVFQQHPKYKPKVSLGRREGPLCCQVTWRAGLWLHFCPGSHRNCEGGGWHWHGYVVMPAWAPYKQKEKNHNETHVWFQTSLVSFLFRPLWNLCPKMVWASSWRWAMSTEGALFQVSGKEMIVSGQPGRFGSIPSISLKPFKWGYKYEEWGTSPIY